MTTNLSFELPQFLQYLKWDLTGSLFIAKGILVTMQYSLLSVTIGFILGVLLAVSKMSNNKPLRIFANIYTSIFRGTPLLIQLSIIYYGIPSLFPSISLTPFSAGILTFGLNSSAYVSEIIRAGINSVDQGQFIAAEMLGIPKFYIFKDIVIPQALRNILPSLVNELINMTKETAIISTLGELDIMRRANLITMQRYDYFGPMLIAAIYYYLLVLIQTIVMNLFEKKLAIKKEN